MTTAPLIRLRTPPDVLAAIPFVIGYHPRDSVVVLALRDRDMTVAARDDLPDPEEGRAGVTEHAANLATMVLRVGGNAVFLAAYGPAERADPVMLELMEEFAFQGVRVLEALRVDDGRYWSYLCSNPDCCPPDGQLDESASSAVAAEWVMAGRVARRDRAEWEAQLSEVTGPEREAMFDAANRATDRLLALISATQTEQEVVVALLAAARSAVDDAVEGIRAGGRPDDDLVAWLSVLVMDTDVRHQAWTGIKGAGPDLDHHYALWTEVVRRCEPDVMPAPACLLAFAAWRTGNGGVARLALERALRSDPDYPMAIRMLQVLAHGVSPTTFDDADGAWVENAILAEDLSDLAQFTPRRGPRRRRRSSSRRAGTRRA